MQMIGARIVLSAILAALVVGCGGGSAGGGLVDELVRARISGNEASAIGTLRAINSGQITYSVICGGGYAKSLPDLAQPQRGSDMGFVSADLGSETVVKSGYIITMRADKGAVPSPGDTCHDPAHAAVSAYFAEAHPSEPGSTGQRSFATDSSGTIYISASGQPIQTGMKGTEVLP